MNRVVEAEILDGLDAGDVRAVRSRRDLRLVNFFMRGEAWILSELGRMSGVKRVVELGAGEGYLGNAVKRSFPELEVVCLDLVSRPKGLGDGVIWKEGDLFEYDGYDESTVVIANLFLHHLLGDDLRRLGDLVDGCLGFLAAEPFRGRVPLMMGRLLFPFVNDVTRHDMLVSIRAGFRKSELGELVGGGCKWSNERGTFGGIRVKGVRG